MNKQIQARQLRQRQMVGSKIFMIAGIIFLTAGLFIHALSWVTLFIFNY